MTSKRLFPLGSPLGRLLAGAVFLTVAASTLDSCSDDGGNMVINDRDLSAPADLSLPPEADMAVVDLAVVPDMPTLTSVAPALGPTTGGVSVTLTGMNFTGAAPKVSFAGTQAGDVKVQGTTQLVVTLPAKPGAWGAVPVTITLEDGRTVTRSDLFRYYAGQVDFQRPTGFDGGKEPAAVALGDFNGDKKEDIAVAGSGGDSIGLLLGNGDGTFQDPKPAKAGEQPVALRAVDINGDGKLDLVVANSYADSISVLLGKGDGTFEAAKNQEVLGRPMALVVTDLTGDGKLDVAVASYSLGRVTVLPGKGDGTFDATAVKTVSGFNKPVSIDVGELTGDMKGDLVVANAGAGLSVLTGKGDGTFEDAKPLAVGDVPLWVHIADVNGDKKADLAVASSAGAGVAVVLGNGDGTFGQPKTFTTGRGPNTVTSGDFNGDGKVDLVATCYDDAAVSVLIGQGDGTFPTEVRTMSLLTPYSVAARDVNGDSRPDLVVATSSVGRVQILLNSAK